jgi:5-methyltetrahydropteroyltriglutamate--homocysteine methyltransferase
MLHKQMTSELGTSEITVKIHREDGSEFTMPAEPIGSIPRPVELIERVAKGDGENPNLAPLYEDAIRDTIERFEATGSPVVTDVEQRKYHNFCTYCVYGLPNTAPNGFIIPFSEGHTRRLWRLTRDPFR